MEQQAMTIPQRKAQLKKLIDSVKDPAVLEKVAKVLEKPVRQSAIVKRAVKAEESIKAGLIYPWDQVNDEMGALIEDLYSKPKKVAKRATRVKADQ